jgi:hypothetical protein
MVVLDEGEPGEPFGAESLGEEAASVLVVLRANEDDVRQGGGEEIDHGLGG